MASRKQWLHVCATRLGKSALAVTFGLILLFSCADMKAQEGRKLVKKVDPVYPEFARKLNLYGVVKVEIQIAADGSVTEVRTLGGNPVFVAAVEQAVKQWKYASGPAETKKLEFKF